MKQSLVPNNFTVETHFHYAAAVADFNHDGKADLAVTYQSATSLQAITSILFGSGAGNFAPPQFAYPGRVAEIADFNNDGNLDLVLLNGTNTFALLRGDGAGNFAPPINTDMGNPFSLLLAKDLNGDGKLDLVAPGAIFLGRGDGSFNPPASLALDLQRSYRLAIADFNNDAKPDLLVFDYGSTTMAYLGDGTGRYDPARAVSLDSVPGSVVSDFDGDGRLDLAGANYDAPTVNLWLNDCQADPGVSTSGQVTDQSTGLGLGSFVYVYLRSVRLGQIVAQTDTNGRYVFRNLARDDDYTLTVAYPPYSFSTKTVSQPATDQVVDFSGTSPTHKLSGRVSESNGAGVPGVQLLLKPGWGPKAEADA